MRCFSNINIFNQRLLSFIVSFLRRFLFLQFSANSHRIGWQWEIGSLNDFEYTQRCVLAFWVVIDILMLVLGKFDLFAKNILDFQNTVSGLYVCVQVERKRWLRFKCLRKPTFEYLFLERKNPITHRTEYEKNVCRVWGLEFWIRYSNKDSICFIPEPSKPFE